MASRSPTALASMTAGILSWAERQGIDRSSLLGPAERAQLLAAGTAGRIPRDLHVSIWTGVERELADPSFALRSASSILAASSFGPVGMLAMTSRTVGDSMARSARYSRVLRDDVVTRMHLDERELLIELWTREPPTRAIADASLYAFRHFVEEWTGRAVVPRAAFFRHRRPDDAREYERFGCPVHFEHPVDAIAFDRALSAVPLLTAQPEVAAYLETVADASMRELSLGEGSLDLRARVAVALRGALAAGRSDIEHVARAMGMSPRSLQRALAADRLSYRQVLDEVRYLVAAPLLAGRELSLEQIAERVGYADGKAFRRAFRRWSGMAPRDARRGP
jgi:AraC-like DNA-binding protein